MMQAPDPLLRSIPPDQGASLGSLPNGKSPHRPHRMQLTKGPWVGPDIPAHRKPAEPTPRGFGLPATRVSTHISFDCNNASVPTLRERQ